MNEAGQRFDKYLKKYLKEASSGFLYKMLRKKNITLNEKKADGSELLVIGDSVELFFSDETFSTFMSIDSACIFFGISRPKIMQSIKKNKAIEVPIRTAVKNDIDSEIKTELVRFI